ncbi:hypothetical protein BH11BAC2_BH11BAC2_19340 [soil metagenome]
MLKHLRFFLWMGLVCTQSVLIAQKSAFSISPDFTNDEIKITDTLENERSSLVETRSDKLSMLHSWFDPVILDSLSAEQVYLYRTGNRPFHYKLLIKNKLNWTAIPLNSFEDFEIPVITAVDANHQGRNEVLILAHQRDQRFRNQDDHTGGAILFDLGLLEIWDLDQLSCFLKQTGELHYEITNFNNSVDSIATGKQNKGTTDTFHQQMKIRFVKKTMELHFSYQKSRIAIPQGGEQKKSSELQLNYHYRKSKWIRERH